MRRILFLWIYIVFLIFVSLKNNLYALEIIVSNSALEKIVREIVIEHKIYQLQSEKEDFHFYEPTLYQWQKIETADLVIIVGTETWAKKVYDLRKNKVVLSLAKGKMRFSDPHLWFDLERVKILIKDLADYLSKKDPSRSKLYQKKVKNFLKSLEKIQKDYKDLKKCKYKEIYILGHPVFSYLLKNSGIKFKGDLIICSTAGEETDGCGAKRFVSKYKEALPKLAGIIIPEPTDFKIVNFHRGICWLKITTKGQTAHGSVPHLGINAISSMTALLNRLARYTFPDVKTAFSDASTMSINQICGGKATNVVPDSCSIMIDIRMAAGVRCEMVVDDMNEIFAELKSEDSTFEAELDVMRTVPVLETEPTCDFIKTISGITNIDEINSINFSTDGPYFKALNTPVIVFGPGKTELAHQPDEYIDVTDLEHAVEVYSKIIEDIIV